MTNKKLKILIVEDQEYPLMALEDAVKKVFPRHFPEADSTNYQIAKSYSEAQDEITSNPYDFVFLDHRLPMENQGNLEDEDMDRFSASLENIGYGLIPLIKAKSQNTCIIGTSSMLSELHYESTPDYTMSKQFGKAEKDLDRILSGIIAKN